MPVLNAWDNGRIWSDGGRCKTEARWSPDAVRELCEQRGWYNYCDCRNDFRDMLALVRDHSENPTREIVETVAANIFAHTDPSPKITRVRKALLRLIRTEGDTEKVSYYERNREHIMEYQRQYYAKNREKMLEYQRQYYTKNHDGIREKQRARYNRRKKAQENT